MWSFIKTGGLALWWSVKSGSKYSIDSSLNEYNSSHYGTPTITVCTGSREKYTNHYISVG